MFYYKHLNEEGTEVGIEIRTIDIYGKKESVLEITKEECEILLSELNNKENN